MDLLYFEKFMENEKMKINDIEAKFMQNCLEYKTIEEIQKKIEEKLDFFGADGRRVCVILEEEKDMFYFQPISDGNYEIFYIDSNDYANPLSCGIYKKSDLKSIGNYLSEHQDRRVNNGVINDYIG